MLSKWIRTTVVVLALAGGACSSSNSKSDGGAGSGGSAAGSGGSAGGSGGSTGGSGGGGGAGPTTITGCAALTGAQAINDCIINLAADSTVTATPVTFTPPVDFMTCRM
jgi:hypothetical protein